MRAIKMLRLVLGVSQYKLAQVSKVSVRELARIEAGEQLPRRETTQGLDAGFDQIVTERLSQKSVTINHLEVTQDFKQGDPDRIANPEESEQP